MPITRDAHVTPTITASGTTQAQYKAGGLKAVLDNLVSQNAAKANPSAAMTAAVTAATGGLPAGVYFASYTNCDAFGETTPGSSEVTFTVTGTAQLATLTLPALPTGVQSRNIYVTLPGGASGSEVLYATGITATSVPLDIAPSFNVAASGVPTVNSTGAAAHTQRIYAILHNAATEGTFVRLVEDLSNYRHGDAMSRSDIMVRHLSWTGIFKLWSTAMSEIATLVANNMPTASSSATSGVGYPRTTWTLP